MSAPSRPSAGRDPERLRLAEDERREKNWKRWGPYLAERQWGTVREDYSADGENWGYFTHEDARSRAYRWGEDGLLGFCDRGGRLCFALAVWNERDPFLKERLFGLGNPEGNHGEDVKECYYYLDSVPTHSYNRALYKYPQAAFPYAWLREENRRRGRSEPEFELLDTDAFADNRYFDIGVEYAKAGPNDILIRITAVNRGPERAPLHVLPTLWFRNTWSWGCRHEGSGTPPQLRGLAPNGVAATHATLEPMQWWCEPGADGAVPSLLFTENETNRQRLYGVANAGPYVKDAFHSCVVEGRAEAVNPEPVGTKAAFHGVRHLAPGEEWIWNLRLHAESEMPRQRFGTTFEKVLQQRRREADRFYRPLLPAEPEARRVARQAYAGLLWSKQFYHYIVEDWLDGDAQPPPPPAERRLGRNRDWPHLYARDVLSMPDKWEYPWFAAWDSAFHMIPFAHIDPHFAKAQLNLFLREWYLHPNGQLPAYEFNFSDVNPPVHAWACWRVYKITGARGHRDHLFLARTFQKLLMNFTWWVNRKDPDGRHLFAGGFLGLDNIGVFDRSKPLPHGGTLQQADGTAWMAFYCATMLAMALELAEWDSSYEDIASKFFEHFVAIADAVNRLGGTGLWHEEDGFYYDQLLLEGAATPLRLRSLVGVIPLLAVEIISEKTLQRLPEFAKRTRWFLENRRDLAAHISYLESDGKRAGRYLLAIPSKERLQRVLQRVLAEAEFLSPYGVRSLSKIYERDPYILHLRGGEWRVPYTPGESDSGLFGGNSNWRGPVWFPINYLLIEALERYHHFYGDDYTVEYPAGSGRHGSLAEIARDLGRRLSALFLPDGEGRRPAMGEDPRVMHDPHWRELLWFHEYFHGDTGQGLGASHQTGWTALVTHLLDCART